MYWDSDEFTGVEGFTLEEMKALFGLNIAMQLSNCRKIKCSGSRRFLQNVGASILEMLTTGGNCAVCTKASETVTKIDLKTLQRIGHHQSLMCHTQAYLAVCVMYSHA